MVMGSLLFFLLFLLYEVASEPEVIVVRAGQKVILPCQTGEVTIRAAEWTRAEPKPSKDILLYTGGQLHPTHQQDSSFKDRVYLVDDELKTRNVSLILKNVSRDDGGTYRCRVETAGSGRKKRDTITKDLELQVTDSEPVVLMGRLGQDVILPCDADDVTIRAVEWTRSEPQPSKRILFYRDGHSDQTNQHSSFKDRVQLVDGELKNGNVSLILKNVKREDVGTYGCRVVTAGSSRKKRAVIKTDPISIVQLLVTDPENEKGDNNYDYTNNNNNNGGDIKDNFTHQHVGLGAAAGVVPVCLAVVGFFLFRKPKIQRYKTPELSAAE